MHSSSASAYEREQVDRRMSISDQRPRRRADTNEELAFLISPSYSALVYPFFLTSNSYPAGRKRRRKLDYKAEGFRFLSALVLPLILSPPVYVARHRNQSLF